MRKLDGLYTGYDMITNTFIIFENSEVNFIATANLARNNKIAITIQAPIKIKGRGLLSFWRCNSKAVYE